MTRIYASIDAIATVRIRIRMPLILGTVRLPADLAAARRRCRRTADASRAERGCLLCLCRWLVRSGPDPRERKCRPIRRR